MLADGEAIAFQLEGFTAIQPEQKKLAVVGNEHQLMDFLIAQYLRALRKLIDVVLWRLGLDYTACRLLPRQGLGFAALLELFLREQSHIGHARRTFGEADDALHARLHLAAQLVEQIRKRWIERCLRLICAGGSDLTDFSEICGEWVHAKWCYRLDGDCIETEFVRSGF